MGFMQFIQEQCKKDFVKRVVVFLIIIGFFYVFKSFANLFILTFLFAYIVGGLVDLIDNKIKKYIKIKKRYITIVIYMLLIGGVIGIGIKYFPILVFQIKKIFNELLNINYIRPKNYFEFMVKFVQEQLNVKQYLNPNAQDAFKVASYIWTFGFNLIVSLILSFFYLEEREKTVIFMDKFSKSKIDWVYKYFMIFKKQFLNTFGKVVQAQLLIAVANVVLSIIGLSLMGFPQLLGLGFMIFFLSLVPVAGVIISFLPLAIIAYNIGGPIQVLYVLIMILAIHAIESYVLNPKFMSDKTELPVFFTFLVLLISEHFLGIWGLLLGIPLFIFILNLLDIKLGNEKK